MEPNENRNDEKITPGELSFRQNKSKGEEKEKTEFQKKVENFFYYHKWKVIAAAFVIFVVVVCSVQMSKKTEPDAYLVYAGGQNIGKIGQNGDISEYQKLLAAVKPFAEDCNGDGKVTVSLETLFVLSEEEKAAIQATLDKGQTFNEQQLSENATMLSESLLLGDNFVYLLSASAYEKNAALFLPLAPYADGALGEEAYYAENAVKLSATPLGAKPGFSSLPEDTVICIRMRNEGLGNVGKAKNEKKFAAAEDLVRAFLQGK